MGYPTPPTGELDSHPQEELDRAKEKRVAFEARFENQLENRNVFRQDILAELWRTNVNLEAMMQKRTH
jgi:hypothetical protein